MSSRHGSRAIKRTSVVALATLLISVPLVGVGLTDAKTVEDADDVAGSLDIFSVSDGHHERRLMHQVTMHEPWDNSVLSGDSYIYFSFYFANNDKSITVDVSPGGTLYAEILRWDGETVLG